MNTKTNSQSSPRGRILEVAADLFYSEGIRAVGIDRIISDAEVAKASFYKHFPSKDDLIVAYLHHRDTIWREWLKKEVEKLSLTPAGRPLAIFDAIARRFSQKDFRGCAFGNTVSEVADRTHPAHKAAQMHKKEVAAYIAGILDEAGYGNAEALSVAFMMLIDGATVTAVRDNSPDAALQARQIAALLLEKSKS